MRESRTIGIAVLTGIMMAGGFSWGEAAVSTVDSQELFHSQLVKESKGNSNAQQAARAVDDAVRNLPELNSRLHWSAVKTPEQLAEEEKAAQRQKKAVPIIITAADIDRERKAKKRGEKTDIPAIITPQPLEPAVRPAPKPAPVKPAEPQPQIQTEVDLQIQPVQPAPTPLPAQTAEVVELPPVQPVGQVLSQGVETVELEIEKLPQSKVEDAIVESTSIELNVSEFSGNDTVELPPIEPVR
ncbi:hypothetical protein SELR_23100 [Selenomonas ruminantium subsp. lactilytica TAM6421]|uniref:Uncharacterized protein n=1 Tax=Selenomonas ruminantium subsp. lactilytica (strain NBRC 103574 / TAM6421) TaxID=927704 RepID=I0GTD1_SELRL|nr:hypothetical protein [Selenomonas ruminantium]BAL84018.1 hypothetical protein SELR_23100 [Selenomonas ruminantium subsp. lactilytica TAM6421]